MDRTVQQLDLRIRNARPQVREATIKCGGGLALRVLPQGAKIFAMRYRPKGSQVQRRVTIGHYPDMTLAKARIEAERLRSEVRNGYDPSVEIRRQRLSMGAPATVDDLSARFLSGYVALKNKPSTAAETGRLLRTYILPAIGKLRLRDVQKADIAALVRREADRIRSARKGAKGVAANRIKAAASKLFTFAVSEGWLIINPASGIESVVSEQPRERTLSRKEIGQLWNALALSLNRTESAPMTPRIVAMLLLTGARASEVATLRLKHLDRDASTITFEAASNKGGNRTIPLSAAALDALLPAVEATKPGKPAFLFPAAPSPPGGRGRPLTRTPHIHRESVTRAGARIADDLGHNKPIRWSVHDLRRSFITWAHESGYEPDLVRRVTGHAARDVHGRVYDRSKRLESMRQLMNAWAAYVADCGAEAAGHDAPNVVRLARA